MASGSSASARSETTASNPGWRGLVVVPTYNEAENVVALAHAVLEAHRQLHFLVVDDASPDGTAALVRKAQEREPRIHLVEREGKLGLGTAYLAGFRYGLDRGYSRILTMDGDWSHSPRHLSALLAGMADHDVMIGSRYIPGGGIANWPFHRRLLSRFANLYTRVLLRLPVNDCTSGYRCYAREVLETVRPEEIRSSGYSFLEEILVRAHRSGFLIGETPITFEDRQAGASKIDHGEIYRAAWHVLRTSVRPPPVRPRRAERQAGREHHIEK